MSPQEQSLKTMSSISNPLMVGGRETFFVDVPKKKYSCQFCYQMMCKPMQDGEGILGCKLCFDKRFTTDNIPVFEDKMILKEIKNLSVKCYYHDKCDWIGPLSEITDHESKSCRFSKTTCEYCENEILLINFKEHEKDCMKMKECEICGKWFEKWNEHRNSCGIRCLFGCEKPLQSNNIKQHYRDCPMVKNHKCCPYKFLLDCSYEPKNEYDLDDHMKEHLSAHKTIVERVVLQQSEIINLKSKLEEKTKKVSDLEDKIGELNKTFEGVKLKCNDLLKQKEELQTKEKELTERLKKVEYYCKDYDAKMERLEELASKIDSSLLREQIGDRIDMKLLENIHNNSKLLNSLEREVTQLNGTLSDFDIKLKDLQTTSLNGKLVWRVENIMYKISQSESGRISPLHSPACYTHLGGYKFCVRIYLNGDGSGYNNSFSIYFVLMKNYCDDLLKWPFHKRVTFKLHNLEDSSKTKIEQFITDKKSASFQKPKKEMNIAAGSPRFISKDELINGGFIKDDCIFIETIVGDITPSMNY